MPFVSALLLKWQSSVGEYYITNNNKEHQNTIGKYVLFRSAKYYGTVIEKDRKGTPNLENYLFRSLEQAPCRTWISPAAQKPAVAASCSVAWDSKTDGVGINI